MTFIKPTVGRIVLCKSVEFEGERPAIITGVHDDGAIDVEVFARSGDDYKRIWSRRHLVQEGETVAEGDLWCYWMPYQKAVASGQAAPTLHAVLA